MAENSSYTLAEGDNYGGVIAGQINFAQDPSPEREKIIAWLSPVDFWQKQDDVFSDAHPGTGQWFLDLQQFQRWLSGDPRHMWCHGAPGSGKTVMTSIVVNHLRQLFSGKQEVGIAVLYCEWRQQEVQSLVNLLASIWNQLVVDKPLSMEVEALYKKSGARVKPKYHDVLSILKSEIERLSSVYIVLDALDELTEHNDCSKVLVEALSRLTPVSSQKVKILATSRSKRSVLARSELVHIVAKGEDIERFVEARFQQGISSSDDLSCRARDDQALKETMVLAIGKRANGLFLLARLFLDTLKHKTNLRDLRGAVQKLPQSINEQYVETWKRIEQQNLEHRDLGKRILSWLVHAIRPLKVQELSHALATREGDKFLDTERLDARDLLLPCCHGLVVIDDETQIIRLVHYSTQEYLYQHRSNLFPDAQCNILSTCLTYLSFEHFKRGRCEFESFDYYANNMAELVLATRIAKSRFLPKRLKRFPFLQYAASNWGRHAVGEREISHQTEILGFLEDHGLAESAAQVQNSDLLYMYWEHFDHIKSVSLFIACSFGLDHITATLLKRPNGFDVNARLGWRDNLVLHGAVESGNSVLTGLLLNAGADPELVEFESASGVCHPLLYKAIAHGHNDIIAMLLSFDHNRLINSSTIYCASYRENEPVIESMIACTDDETRRRERLHQFLFHAASLGRLPVIQLAMRLGANVETKDNNGQTALGLAVRHGRCAAVELLLKIQAARTAQRTFGAGLLHLSASSREAIEERMRFIRHIGLEYAGIPQMRKHTDTKEERPSSMEEPIVLGNAFTERLAVLLDDMDETEVDGYINFMDYEEHYALSELKDLIFDDSDHVQIMKMLLPHTVDVNELDPEGETILHHAVKGSSERVRTLVESFKGRLDIDSPNKKGWTPLHYAAAMGSTKIMKMLLAYGANIALRDDDHATTLHYSVNSSACTQLSIDHGVSLNDQDSFGRTALNYARLVRETNAKVQEVLVRAGAKASAVGVRKTIYFPGSTKGRHYVIQRDRDSNNRGCIDWLDSMFEYGCSGLKSFHDALWKYNFYLDNCEDDECEKNNRDDLARTSETSEFAQVDWTIVSDSEDEDFKWRYELPS